MFMINSYKDLFTRPILEALIEKRSLRGQPDEERPFVRERTRIENRNRGTDTDYVFDIPPTDVFRNKAGRGLLELAADEQDAQYIIAQIMLSNLGLIPKVYRSRRINVNPSNTKRINKIKNLLLSLFSRTILDDNAPAWVLKDLITKSKIDLDNEVGFNTFDLLSRKSSWEEVLGDNLKRNIARTIAGLDRASKKRKKFFQDYISSLALNSSGYGDDDDDDNEKPKTFGDIAKNVYGEAVENDYNDDPSEKLSQEEKERMFVKAYKILKPLYETASKSGLSPVGYLKFQQELDRIVGALNTSNIRRHIKSVESYRQPVTVEDYKDVLLEALGKAVTGDDSKVQVSNLIAKQANTSLRWLTRHLSKLGYKGGLKINNIFDYIKNGEDKYAEEARYYLNEIYDIKPEDLTTENYPNFKTFIDKLYRSDKKILSTYKSLKTRPRAKKRLNLKRVYNSKGEKLPMVRKVAGGLGNSEAKIRESLASAQKALENFDAKNEELEKAVAFNEDWKANRAKMFVAVSAGALGMGRKKLDTTPVIVFGNVTLSELKKMTEEHFANGYVDLVDPKFKEAYIEKLKDNPDLPVAIRTHINKQKNMAPNKIANDLRFKLGKTFGGTGEAARQKYIDRVNYYRDQLTGVTGIPTKLEDFSDEPIEGYIDQPYTVFKIDETAPRLINPIIASLQKQLANFNVTVEWSPSFDDEEGFITIYYPEDGVLFKQKDPEQTLEALQRTIQKHAIKLDYPEVKVTIYSYEFKNAQYDPFTNNLVKAGLLPKDKDENEEDINFDDENESEEVEEDFMSEDEEDEEDPLVSMALSGIKCDGKYVKKVKMIPNKDRYPREALQNQWRYSYFWDK